MTRNQIIKSIGKLKRLLEESKIRDIIRHSHGGVIETSDATIAMKSVIQNLEKFDEFDKEFLDKLEIGFLKEDEFWISLLNQETDASDIYEPINSAIKFLPRLTKIIEREYEYFDEKNYQLKNMPYECLESLLMAADTKRTYPSFLCFFQIGFHWAFG